MGLSGKKATQIEIKGNGDAHHELLRYRLNDLSNFTPDNVQGCELLQGEWGAVGSIVNWTYLIDGKPQASKTVLEAADDKNKSITLRQFEGDMMQIYKSLRAHICVTQKGENSVVTWTLEYEKMNESVPELDLVLDLVNKISKDIDTRQLQLQLQ